MIFQLLWPKTMKGFVDYDQYLELGSETTSNQCNSTRNMLVSVIRVTTFWTEILGCLQRQPHADCEFKAYNGAFSIYAWLQAQKATAGAPTFVTLVTKRFFICSVHASVYDLLLTIQWLCLFSRTGVVIFHALDRLHLKRSQHQVSRTKIWRKNKQYRISIYAFKKMLQN